MTAEEIERLGKSLVAPRTSVAIAGGPLLENNDGVRTAAAVSLLNYVCGAVGKNVDFGATSSMSGLSPYREILGLVASMEEDRVPLLLLNEVNPVFHAPGR